jgi:NADH-quinone oxidoreductase subunit F
VLSRVSTVPAGHDPDRYNVVCDSSPCPSTEGEVGIDTRGDTLTDVRSVVIPGTDGRNLTRLEEYRSVGGYVQLGHARALEPGQVIDELVASGVRGHGGAGFPLGRKASFLTKGTDTATYVAVNADESEPGTFKDRELMRRVPHRLIEGCLTAAHGIGCRSVFIYVRGEYLTEFEIASAALDEARDAGLLGEVTVALHRGTGAYICGEETAPLESLEGARW